MSYEGIAISLSIKAQALGKKPNEVRDKKIKNRWINSRYMSTLINTFVLLILFEYQEN